MKYNCDTNLYLYKIHDEVEYTYGLYASLTVKMLQRD